MSFLVNLTPHAITIVSDGGNSVTVPPSGEVARVTTTTRRLGSSGGVQFFAQETGETTGLPPEVPSEHGGHLRVFIVSSLVRLAHPERRDLASPGELIRDKSGQPIGCRGLILNR